MEGLKTLINEIVKITGGNNAEELYDLVVKSAEVLASNEIATGDINNEVTLENAQVFLEQLKSEHKTEEFTYLRDQHIVRAIENYLKESFPSLTEEQKDKISKLLEE